MWSLLPRRRQIFVIVAAALVISHPIVAVTDFLFGQQTSAWRLPWLVTLCIAVILVPLANVLWRPVWRRFPALERLVFPDLNGTWKGQICSTWIEPDTGTRPGPISVTVSIRQSLFSTTLRLQSKGATSQSTWCRLEADRAAGIFRVLYLYDYRPKATVRGRMERHDGHARLELNIGAGRDRLVGDYFTDQKSSGDMELQRVARD